MKQIVNEVYSPLFTTDKRYIILIGGRGAGRSTVASQYATARLASSEYFRCAIMRYVLGDIRNSIYREITDRAEENGILEALHINDSQMVIDYGANSINAVGFKKSSSDQKAKLKSLANYNCVIIEEADEIPEEDFIQLDDSLRTMKGDIRIILLLNPPPKSHWIVKRFFNVTPSEAKDFYIPVLKPEINNTLVIRSSYKDNMKNIDPETRQRYEGYKVFRPSHYYNMIAGLVPETVKGKVFSNWREIEAIPYEARLERLGMDFGYSNDPTAIVAVYYFNGGYILDELLYKKGMSNKNIADFIRSTKLVALVIADSAEPKSIDEIALYDINILPATKGPGSVNTGIQFIKDQKISYTKRSIHLKEEYENYAWITNKDGETLNEPIDMWNHCFAPETKVFTYKGLQRIDEIDNEGYIYSRNGKFFPYKDVRVTRENAQVYTIEFETGETLSVTKDHLLLKPDGTWIEASLLEPQDLIQSVMYGNNTNIFRRKIHTLQKREVLISWAEKITQSCLGTFQWESIKRFPYSSQRWESAKQRYYKFRDGRCKETFSGTYDRRKEKEIISMGRKDTTTNKEVACIKRGERVAQITWTENVCKQSSFRERVCFLWKDIFYKTICSIRKILSPELQNERETKTVKRITREFRSKVYNLEVEGSHCLWANGVIAHNCMDASRYAFSTIVAPGDYERKTTVTYHDD